MVYRGWRRSGTYFYKPDCKNACCPNYTIRLEAAEYRPCKDHRKTTNAWNTFVLGREYRAKAARLSPRSRDEKRWRKNHFDLGAAVHEVESSNVLRPIDPKTKESIKPSHELEVSLEPDSFTEEKFALFKDYQLHVHKESPDEVTRTGFKRFLCSGLGQSHRIRNGELQKLGSYHQCYRLDGQLVAIGVLDLLPDCVSSVYLIYHQDVQDWYFGKLSAMREILMALEGGYRYYMMGFYIHSCVKMRYKNQYQPSSLLDPETYTWNVLDEDHLARISARKYVSMSVERQYDLPACTAGDAYLGRPDDKELYHYLQASDTTRENHNLVPNSAFAARMPGLMSLDAIRDGNVVDGWRIKLSGGRIVFLKDLKQRDRWDMEDTSTLEGIMAELAATLGPSLVSQLTLNIS
ncbi:MAG: hypothetical protein Q9220_005122 [cf. Caloplaca sp. 1 TL-2023]